MTENYRGIDYLRIKLSKKQPRVKARYAYYEMKNSCKDFNFVIPKQFRNFKEVLGWCGKSVDSIADRLSFLEFREDNFDMNQIFRMNNADILFDSAILSALISSCCFIYISEDDNGYPRLQVIDGYSATGIMDDVTGMLKEGYAVLQRDQRGNPLIEAYLIAGETWIYESGLEPYCITNAAPYPLLVPIVYRPDAWRPFGHSRISRACMGIMQSTLRTIKRSEISAEFYSFPQKYALGTDPDKEQMDNFRATISSFIEFTKDSEGDKPTLGQFSQQSMSPFTEQIRMFASLFAGETGLTLDDLGFVAENPSSAEAIRASHENLRLTARKAQRTFGSGFLNTGYLAACVRDDFPYQRSQIYMTKPSWEPIFEPDASMMSGIGDAIGKINGAIPGYFGKDNMRELMGIAPED